MFENLTELEWKTLLRYIVYYSCGCMGGMHPENLNNLKHVLKNMEEEK